MTGALATHLTVGQAAKLRINNRSKLIERARLAVAPGLEQGADVARNLWLGFVLWHGPAALQFRCT
jgi:hypothetical protein